jgi:formyltetrahydrofolate hydrolase
MLHQPLSHARFWRRMTSKQLFQLPKSLYDGIVPYWNSAQRGVRVVGSMGDSINTTRDEYPLQARDGQGIPLACTPSVEYSCP